MSYKTLVKGTQVLLVVALGAFLLGACSYVKLAPKVESDKALAMDVPAGKALVYFYRINSKLVKGPLSVEFNGKKIGKTDGNTFYLFEVSPGPVKAVSLGLNAAIQEFNAQAGARYYLQQYIHPGVFKPSTSLKIVGEDEGKSAVAKTRLIKVVKL